MSKYSCGPDSWSPTARKYLGKVLNEEGCRQHDADWSKPDADKKAADKQFLKSQFTWWKPWSWFIAPIAYAAVKYGGSKAFEAAQAKA